MNITGWQLAIVALLILLLFGAPKLPGLAKSVGQSMRIFKSEVRSLNEEDDRGEAGQHGDRQQQGRDGEAGGSRHRTVEGPVVNGEPSPAEPTEAEQHPRHS
ncbi:twin-arginine translocase TatA/TatE family subunit [Nesterenkonia aerolata]|uniref:Sec-independent protein translocase protein TatA n=1 Tax=Nesterenkonia aerolata TaxID=3074079 RepID=A0ABU2DQ68_9MICC|nr:twin-arginine translocase TatA/TatE family subunit [Nesterenkonia sp. LY-0111]MDR8018631.1 twin-arginine translocase TatA/TatE family subunit [Nesterenkonia sp. LY-0111]